MRVHRRRQRRACRLIGMDVSSYLYRSRRPDDGPLREWLRALERSVGGSCCAPLVGAGVDEAYRVKYVDSRGLFSHEWRTAHPSNCHPSFEQRKRSRALRPSPDAHDPTAVTSVPSADLQIPSRQNNPRLRNNIEHANRLRGGDKAAQVFIHRLTTGRQHRQ